MLELQHVSLALKQDGRQLVDDFSFTLQPGDRAVIIGEEGNGKSTLLKWIYDQAAAACYCDCAGKVIARGRVAYLPQSTDGAQDDTTPAEMFAQTEWYMQTELLEQLGLSPEMLVLQRPLRTLSGGERVKVRLARLLLDEPDILLLDEPTNDLDLETLAWLERFLCAARQPVLYISHDETLIERTANVILHMEQLIRKTQCRMTVARMGYRDYLAARRAGFAHQAQVAQKQRDDYARQMAKWRQIYDRVDHEQREISRGNPGGGRLLKKKMHSVLSTGRRFAREKESFLDFPQEEEAILTAFDPGIRLPAGKTVLALQCAELRIGERVLAGEIRLHVAGGEHVGIVGCNGAGKSTLLTLIRDELMGRQDIIPAYMPQNYAERLEDDLSPVEYLAASYSRAEVTWARTCLGSMRFTHEEMTGKIGALSGGQRAKLLFLDMVIRGANVLLLDEPTRNFSPLSGPVVRGALAAFGGTIISVSHDRKYLSEVCSRVYCLDAGGLREISTPL